MRFPLNALVATNTRDLKGGEFAYMDDGSWAMRAVFEETRNTYEGLLYLTGERAGTFEEFKRHENCLTVNAACYSTATETVGGPRTPSESVKKGALVVHHDQHYVISRLRDAVYATKMDGQEATEINVAKLFHFDSWQVFIKDRDSNTVGDSPLFRVEALGE